MEWSAPFQPPSFRTIGVLRPGKQGGIHDRRRLPCGIGSKHIVVLNSEVFSHYRFIPVELGSFPGETHLPFAQDIVPVG
jgi:hypothetical protein